MSVTGPLLAVPALVAGLKEAVWLTPDGEIETLSIPDAALRAEHSPVLVCHAPEIAARLGLERLLRALDVLDLFAFTRPATFCLPTPKGLAASLGLPPPGNDGAAEAEVLMQVSALLLGELEDPAYPHRAEAQRIAQTMRGDGWAWGEAVTEALGAPRSGEDAGSGLAVWTQLPEWEDEAPPPPPDDLPVSEEETQDRLRQLLGEGSEDRAPQRHYASQVTAAFRPRPMPDVPNAVLAEAGTGVGKTLGYLAPATLWAERNKGPVWLSTYTKNLQRQIDQELDRYFPDPARKADRVVLRKGRENYLCLLNLEEAIGRAELVPENRIRLALIARWARYTRDGDMNSGDLPSWLLQRIGPGRASSLTDGRGECIYSACTHWRRCFIERNIRRSRKAELVIANHALVMIHAALYGQGDESPTRYVFDEGHHLFDAANSAFSTFLSGQEMAELRRWIRGGEGNRRNRARGLEKRIGDLLLEDEKALNHLRATRRAATALPGDQWMGRITSNTPQGPAEEFLAALRTHVYARTGRPNDPYSLEAPVHDAEDALMSFARLLDDALFTIADPLEKLAARLQDRLAGDKDGAADDGLEALDSSARTRLEAVRQGILRRVQNLLKPWQAMLRELETGTREGFVDWASVDRINTREIDLGLHRHWIDPTIPFAETVLSPAHGAVITSATLRDESRQEDADRQGERDRQGDDPDNGEDGKEREDWPASWRSAEMRTGLSHLLLPGARHSVPSPFDYAEQTRVFVVTDVNRKEMEQVAGGYRALFEASGGGALGLFTAIARLRAVYGHLAEPMAEAGLALYAQHIDAFDPATLIEIFRAEKDSCLLGTDAVRDGVDVPGEALRLIVFDRVPWPRPTILHRARRDAFGGRGYDDMIARLRLKQAFGRLIRRNTDRGAFVMMDAACPTRLLSAFPPEVKVSRLGLAETVREVRDFLSKR